MYSFASPYSLVNAFIYLPKLQMYIYMYLSFVDYEIQEGNLTQLFLCCT